MPTPASGFLDNKPISRRNATATITPLPHRYTADVDFPAKILGRVKDGERVNEHPRTIPTVSIFDDTICIADRYKGGVNDEPPSSPASRLRAARKAAGFKSASAAARHFDWSEGAYRHHENGTRPFSAVQATLYGRSFSVAPSWLLALDEVVSNDRVPYAKFHVAEYAHEVGEDDALRTAIDDIHRLTGHIMVPELSINDEAARWIQGVDGQPPMHFLQASDLEVDAEAIYGGYVFAFRVRKRFPRSSIKRGDVLIVDSSTGAVGATPELWLMRDNAGPLVTWAQADEMGQVLLLPGEPGQSAVFGSSLAEAEFIGRIVFRMGSP
ncbi:helix-turn-helix transcriptional regulator [Sphingomonas sp. BK235]|uniref:helix-turn-helix domain-containing protein n=1 Tax=Sphingomonas sp. BK235 TaxID=2512131 RepID=UPI00104D29B6|nr:helix-turn-helix transcriptional regulator [Sphingomonas sp. BK235]TCP36533.1 hypothetical protein EV292_10129 [Sphingomonas sp. BK235]